MDRGKLKQDICIIWNFSPIRPRKVQMTVVMLRKITMTIAVIVRSTVGGLTKKGSNKNLLVKQQIENAKIAVKIGNIFKATLDSEILPRDI